MEGTPPLAKKKYMYYPFHPVQRTGNFLVYWNSTLLFYTYICMEVHRKNFLTLNCDRDLGPESFLMVINSESMKYSPQRRIDMDLLEWVQRRPQK